MQNSSKKIDRKLSTFHFPLSTKRGFILAFSVLISGLVLTMGLGIFNIALKELILSSASRDSQLAFYAADTGTECALYWDIKKSSFATTSLPTASGIFCLGSDVTGLPQWNTSFMGSPGLETGSITNFRINFYESPACADIMITKDFTIPETVIESRGYNTCDVDSTKRLERGMKVSY